MIQVQVWNKAVVASIRHCRVVIGPYQCPHVDVVQLAARPLPPLAVAHAPSKVLHDIPSITSLQLMNIWLDTTDGLRFRHILHDMHKIHSDTCHTASIPCHTYTYTHFTLSRFLQFMIDTHLASFLQFMIDIYRYRQIHYLYIQIHVILPAYLHTCTFHT